MAQGYRGPVLDNVGFSTATLLFFLSLPASMVSIAHPLVPEKAGLTQENTSSNANAIRDFGTNVLPRVRRGTIDPAAYVSLAFRFQRWCVFCTTKEWVDESLIERVNVRRGRVTRGHGVGLFGCASGSEISSERELSSSYLIHHASGLIPSPPTRRVAMKQHITVKGDHNITGNNLSNVGNVTNITVGASSKHFLCFRLLYF